MNLMFGICSSLVTSILALGVFNWKKIRKKIKKKIKKRVKKINEGNDYKKRSSRLSIQLIEGLNTGFSNNRLSRDIRTYNKDYSLYVYTHNLVHKKYVI